MLGRVLDAFVVIVRGGAQEVRAPERLGVGAELVFGRDRGPEVDPPDLVALEVVGRVAGVADAVVVGVLLVGIGRVRAVVAGVGDAVPVAVGAGRRG